jgi:hypothetical protein
VSNFPVIPISFSLNNTTQTVTRILGDTAIIDITRTYDAPLTTNFSISTATYSLVWDNIANAQFRVYTDESGEYEPLASLGNLNSLPLNQIPQGTTSLKLVANRGIHFYNNTIRFIEELTSIDVVEPDVGIYNLRVDGHHLVFDSDYMVFKLGILGLVEPTIMQT